MVAVVDQNVGSAVRDTRDGATEAVLSQEVTETIGLLAEAHEVSSQASNVGRGHGRAVQRAGLSAGQGALDVDTRGKDIDGTAEVGEGGDLVSLVGGTDSASAGLRGGRAVGSVGSLVACSDSKEKAGLRDGGRGGVDTLREATAKRHVDDDAIRAVTLSRVLDDKLHTGNNTGAEKLLVRLHPRTV